MQMKEKALNGFLNHLKMVIVKRSITLGKFF